MPLIEGHYALRLPDTYNNRIIENEPIGSFEDIALAQRLADAIGMELDVAEGGYYNQTVHVVERAGKAECNNIFQFLNSVAGINGIDGIIIVRGILKAMTKEEREQFIRGF